MRFIYLGIIAWVVLTVFTVVFAASANSREVRVLSKPIWIVLILFVPIFGALLYLVNGRPLGGRRQASAPVAPDDDPEFLRRLAEQLREEEDKPKDKEKDKDEEGDDKSV